MRAVGKNLILLSVDIFDIDLNVGVNLSEAEFRQRFKKVIKRKDRASDCDPGLVGWDASDGCGRVYMTAGGVLVLLRIKDLIGEVGLIAHEMSHAVTEMMAFSGIPISRDNDEVRSYLLAYLVQKTIDGIR